MWPIVPIYDACKWPYELPKNEKNNKTALTNCQKFVMTGPPKKRKIMTKHKGVIVCY